MNKKEIIILVIVFLTVVAISTVSIYFIINKKPSGNSVDNSRTSTTLKVGKYSLKYGTYKGTENEYDPDTEKIVKKEIKVVLSSDKINDTKYEVKGTSLYVNGYEMYKVTANNKMELLAGEGVELVYEGK